jgi:hypothetical protein
MRATSGRAKVCILSRKRRRKAHAVLVVLAGFAAASLSAEPTYRDVLTMKDGTSHVGVVVEQTPGVELVLETLEGELLTLGLAEVSSMEKRAVPAGEPAAEYADVVFLKDGVIFRGTVVEQVLGESLQLETENGCLLAVDMEEVWKQARQKKVSADVEGGRRERRTRELKLDLQINIVTETSVRDTGEDRDEEWARQERLEEQIQWLEEEIERVEEAKKEEKEAEARRKGQDLQGLAGGMLEAVDEALALESLEEEDRQVLQRAGADMGRLVAQFVQETAVLRDPEPDFALRDAREQVAVRESRSGLDALYRSGDWRRPGQIEDVEAMARSLDREERRELYREHRKRGTVVAVLSNAVPVLAGGSWKQKDLLGALATNAVSIAGLALLGFGFEVTPSTAEGPFGYKNVSLNALGYAGIGLAGGAYAFSLIRPILYAGKWNRDLYRALDLNGEGRR